LRHPFFYPEKAATLWGNLILKRRLLTCKGRPASWNPSSPPGMVTTEPAFRFCSAQSGIRVPFFLLGRPMTSRELSTHSVVRRRKFRPNRGGRAAALLRLPARDRDAIRTGRSSLSKHPRSGNRARCPFPNLRARCSSSNRAAGSFATYSGAVVAWGEICCGISAKSHMRY
jgi:hypothetical protein